MEQVRVYQPRNDSLISKVEGFYRTFKDAPGGSLQFDFSDCNWFSPLLLLPIAAHIGEYGGETFNIPEGIKGYCDRVAFPTGIHSLEELQHYATYIPLAFLTDRNTTLQRERLEAAYQEMIFHCTGQTEGAMNAIYYPISELIDNIFQHSTKQYGWVYAQDYPGKRFLEICICDTGRGFARGYQEELGENYNDIQALQKALEGISVKKLRDRGTGLYTSQEIVCRGMKGSFALISGSALFYRNGNFHRYVPLPNFHWNGAVISYKIPHSTTPVDITPFLE